LLLTNFIFPTEQKSGRSGKKNKKKKKGENVQQTVLFLIQLTLKACSMCMTPVSEDESILDISSIFTLIWSLQESYIYHSSSVGTVLYPQGCGRVE